MDPDLTQRLSAAVDERRLLDTATALIDVPSPTCSAAAVADKLQELLSRKNAEFIAAGRKER